MTFQKETEVIEKEIECVFTWTKIKGDSAFDDIAKGWAESNKKVWLEHTKGRDVVIQAGGCLGLYPRLFAQYFKHVYTFEPVAINFYCLVQNCQVDNVHKFNAALGATHKMVGVGGWSCHNPGLGSVNTNHTRYPSIYD